MPLARTIAPLTEPELAQALALLPQWRHDPARAALHRQIVLADFPAAMAFMVQAGFAAERMDHHPEWANVYNRIDIWLTTHDAGGISSRDVALAQVIDSLA
ncbi:MULTISPECIES: 4a-hydroxytetrahydrobiopterin dehydratase [unclassified Novosphingobium]|uniref:4a-hydroxytetrahydrobiopterin dehydratase n=1 Tax=unclassified Novosphingobium TaxID=2644732 RepID=UPI00146CE418|nr:MULTISPECIES: 4a-hydroxytetrahydrobiopterin dehydratase [unclassified Novosphingobium]NMN04472.1 4a-hydroxytetrahydrobiopterin dehydratase [Novosphingobium sp. SG919]NMN85536.1 4a-hydroxytetrahydrobiopterin dehydratase [Novosphingobium sp. SG916]